MFRLSGSNQCCRYPDDHAMLKRFTFLLQLPVVLFIAHTYVGLRLSTAMTSEPERWLLATLLAVVYLLILGGYLTRRSTGQFAGDLFAWAGFLCLGLFSWLFVLTGLRDIGLLLLYLAQTIFQALSAQTLLEPDTWLRLKVISAALIPILALSLVLFGLFNARRTPVVKHVTVAIPGLPQALNGYCIVQLSDVHVGPTIHRRKVQAMVNRANALKANAIALTGDLVDGSVAQLRSHAEPLGELHAPDGVFAVTGNHEYYSGADAWVNEFNRLGLITLCNQHRVIHHQGETIVLAGINDHSARRFNHHQASNPAAALQGAPEQAAVRIMLAHQPCSAAIVAPHGVDLQLSGHTHGGQFWPWKYAVPIYQPFVAGLHKYGNMQLYISRGSGYWGPPMRIGAPSEITRITLAAG